MLNCFRSLLKNGAKSFLGWSCSNLKNGIPSDMLSQAPGFFSQKKGAAFCKRICSLVCFLIDGFFLTYSVLVVFAKI